MGAETSLRRYLYRRLIRPFDFSRRRSTNAIIVNNYNNNNNKTLLHY